MVACTAPPRVQCREKGQDRRPDPDPACPSELGTQRPAPRFPGATAASASAAAAASLVGRSLPLVRPPAAQCAVARSLRLTASRGGQEADPGVRAGGRSWPFSSRVSEDTPWLCITSLCTLSRYLLNLCACWSCALTVCPDGGKRRQLWGSEWQDLRRWGILPGGAPLRVGEAMHDYDSRGPHPTRHVGQHLCQSFRSEEADDLRWRLCAGWSFSRKAAAAPSTPTNALVSLLRVTAG